MLNVAIHKLGEVTIFRCTGRIAFGYADTLLTAISKWPQSRFAVLDLAEVTWQAKARLTLSLLSL